MTRTKEEVSYLYSKKIFIITSFSIENTCLYLLENLNKARPIVHGHALGNITLAVFFIIKNNYKFRVKMYTNSLSLRILSRFVSNVTDLTTKVKIRPSKMSLCKTCTLILLYHLSFFVTVTR